MKEVVLGHDSERTGHASQWLQKLEEQYLHIAWQYNGTGAGSVGIVIHLGGHERWITDPASLWLLHKVSSPVRLGEVTQVSRMRMIWPTNQPRKCPGPEPGLWVGPSRHPPLYDLLLDLHGRTETGYPRAAPLWIQYPWCSKNKSCWNQISDSLQWITGLCESLCHPDEIFVFFSFKFYFVLSGRGYCKARGQKGRDREMSGLKIHESIIN